MGILKLFKREVENGELVLEKFLKSEIEKGEIVSIDKWKEVV